MADNEGAQQTATERAAAPDPGRQQDNGQPPETGGLAADALAVWDATRALADSVHGFARALLGLAQSEWRLARASWPLLVAVSIILVGLSLSLWASLIALLGWGLYVATGAVGWALAALVGVHLVLLLLARWLLRRTARNMTMPATRAELQDLVARARGTHSTQSGEPEQ